MRKRPLESADDSDSSDDSHHEEADAPVKKLCLGESDGDDDDADEGEEVSSVSTEKHEKLLSELSAKEERIRSLQADVAALRSARRASRHLGSINLLCSVQLQDKFAIFMSGRSER